MSPPRCSELVKLSGNSTGHAYVQMPPPRSSESVKLRGNSTGHAPRSAAWRSESVKLRRNSTGHASKCRLPSSSPAEPSPASRMRSRSVLAQAFASVCKAFAKHSRVSRGGHHKSWSRNTELSSLLVSCRVVASQKCQQSQG